MAYQPPKQKVAGQIFDILLIVVLVFGALWLPLSLGLAGASQEIQKVENPTWETLGQNTAMAEQWEKLGYTPDSAHDIITNKFNYDFSWVSLIILAFCLLAYFMFLFRMSENEYQEVIREKFDE